MASNDGQNSAPATAVRGQAPATTRHAAGGSYVPHGPVLLHGVAHELGDKLSVAATGQAELFGLRDRTDVVLKVYFAGRNPKARATKEMLERYQAIRSPHLMRLLDFGFGADGLDGEHDWELLERLEEVVAPKDDEARLGWISASVVPAVRAAIDALLSRHLVHCDIKKPNLMARHGTGDLVLVDIGSLKEIDPQNRTSVTTVLSTTTVYAAPELLRHHVNDTTDAFALGMLLLDLVNPALIAPPADKEVVARITENKPVVDVIPTAPRLTDLINGLTRNAVSARWGVGELAIWCSGGTVAKMASAPTLPPMRVQGRQITSVDELLSFMQDEGAFWGVCEDEGDLPFTLRQWVNQLHDDEVGAALSRLVKRCLTEGKQEVGLVAVRRVLVPRAPLSVRGRQLAPTEDALSDFIARTGEVTVDMEIALRVWSHRVDAGRAARVLELVAPNSAHSDDPVGTAKRKRFDLFSGIGTISNDWAGAKIRCKLLRGSDGLLPAAELDAAAEAILAAVLVGSADGPWPGDLLPVAVLNPEAGVAPECWSVVGLAVRRRHALLVAVTQAQGLSPMRIEAAGIPAIHPQLLTTVCEWPPAKIWLQEAFGISEQVGEAEGVAEQVLLKTQRPWLLARTAVVETLEELHDESVRAAVMAWFAGDPVRGGRLTAWWRSHSNGAQTFDAVSDPILRAHLLMWSLGERGVWFGSEYLSAVGAADALDEKVMNERESLNKRLIIGWLERLAGEVPWASADARPVIADNRAQAIEVSRLARCVGPVTQTFFVEDCPTRGDWVRVVPWTEFERLRFGLVVAAVDQGCRIPHCHCGYAESRCNCVFEIACAPARELAKQAEAVVLDLTGKRIGGPQANAAADSRLLSSTAQFARGNSAVLADTVRGTIRDVWPDGSLPEKSALSARSLPPWYVPAGGWTSSASKMWLASLLVLILMPGCLALWMIESPNHFEVRDFSWVVFHASLALCLTVLIMLWPFRFLDEESNKQVALAAFVLFVIVSAISGNLPPYFALYLSAVVTVLAATVVGVFLIRQRVDVWKYRWVLGMSSVCVSALSAYGLFLDPWVENSSGVQWNYECAFVPKWIASSKLAPAFAGTAFSLAALFASYAIGRRALEVFGRADAVVYANRILGDVEEMLFVRVSGGPPPTRSDSSARTTASGQSSAVIGRQRDTISNSAEENGDKTFRARVNIREGVNQGAVITFRWYRKNSMTKVIHRVVLKPDVFAQIDSSDWRRLESGAVVAQQLVSQRRLSVDGPPWLVRQFIAKLDSHFARKQ